MSETVGDAKTRRPARGLEAVLRMSRFVGAVGLIGGLGALASLWAFGPTPDDGRQWALLISAMRAVFYPCVFAGIVILLVSGTIIWWRRRAALGREPWFRLMMGIIAVAVPSLHLTARFTMMKLTAAVNSGDTAAAEALWNRLGMLYVAGVAVFLAVSCLAVLKPRFGAPPRT